MSRWGEGGPFVVFVTERDENEVVRVEYLSNDRDVMKKNTFVYNFILCNVLFSSLLRSMMCLCLNSNYFSPCFFIHFFFHSLFSFSFFLGGSISQIVTSR